MYTVTDIAPTDAEFTALIAALDAWQETLYPAESNHLLDLSQLPPQTVIALAIRSPQGEAVGCGAIVLSEEGFGEMKRVYIDPQHRGQQLGEKLLAALEEKARQRDCHTLRLETGIHQHAAITLYTRNGYQTRCAFAPYQPDPLSVVMEKPLFADLRSAALSTPPAGGFWRPGATPARW